MISPRELALVWIAAILYTGYVVGAIYGLSVLLGDAGGPVGVVAGLGPLIAWTFWMVRSA